MSNLNKFDNLIAEELNSEEQATISGGAVINLEFNTTDEVFYKSQGQNSIEFVFNLNVNENTLLLS